MEKLNVADATPVSPTPTVVSAPAVSSEQRSGRASSLGRLTAVFAGGNLVSTILKMVGGFLAARVVEPAIYGLFGGFNLILGYLPFFSLGVFNGLNRELPYHIGRGDEATARDLTAVTQGWAILLGLLTASVLGAVGLWSLVRGDYESAAGWGSFAINGFLFFYATSYLQVTYRTRSEFARLSLVNVISSSVNVVLVLAVWAFGFYGLCIRSIAVSVTAAVLFLVWRPIRVSSLARRSLFKQLVSVGFPIFVVGQVYVFWEVINRTLVLTFMGVEGLGLYSLTLMSIPAISLLPMAVSQITYPRLAELYGRRRAVRPLILYLVKPSLYLVGGMAVVTLVVWFLLPPAVELLLPKYVGGVEAAQWGLVIVALMSLNLVGNIFNVIKQQGLYLIAMASGIAVYVLMLVYLMREHFYLAAFSQAMVAGRGFYSVLCLAFVFWFFWRQESAAAPAT